MKKTYSVTITETLKKTILVKAESVAEAEDIAADLYHDCEVILTADDFTGETEFEGMEI